MVATTCDTNSTGQNGANTSQCTCTSPSVWINGDCVTLTTAICQGLAGSTSTANGTACTCTAPFVFNTIYATCVIDCTQASTNSNGTQFEYDSCYCNATNTAWNYATNTCSFFLNCTNATNSNGTNANSSTCNCNSGFIFNSTLLTCVRDCSSVNQVPTLNTTDTTQCICPSGFTYNFNFNTFSNPQGVCQRNCSLFTRTFSQNTADPLACNCNLGYFFTTTGTVGCTLNCSGQVYSTGVNKNSTTCVCKKDYFFDTITGQCLASTHHSHAVAIAVGIAVPLGVLALIGLALLLWFALTPAVVVPPPVIPVPVSQFAPVPRVVQQPITTTRIVPTNPVPQPIIGYGNPPVVGYGNPPIVGGYGNQPIIGGYGNQPIIGGYNNLAKPMVSGFGSPVVPRF
jgi:hypothetical protein